VKDMAGNETGFAAIRERIKARPQRKIFQAPKGQAPKKRVGLAPGEPCPVCGHDLIGHYGLIDPKTEELVAPYAHECSESGCGCRYGFIRGTEGV
jgi:hypothetical protein